MSEIEDKREEILARLKIVGQTVVAPDCVFRNQVDIPPDKRPALVILDADETADESAYDRGRPPHGPVKMVMQPEIFLLLEASAERVGGTLNIFRRKLLRMILHDASLIALCNEGDIRYLGMQTGLGVGRSMEGESRFDIEFRYILRPTKL